MDSVTQALLGATTFACIKDKETGNKGLLIGAIAATIPDLDVLLFPFYSNVELISIHRGFSHSVFFALIASLILAITFKRLYKSNSTLKSWYAAFFIAIFTHALLDACTTYGTQLLSPFSNHLFSFNIIHVIEPIYTSILLIGLIFLLIKKININRKKTIWLSLVLSSTYLIWTLISQNIAKKKFQMELNAQHIEYETLMLAPTPLNSVLWNAIIKTKEGYYFANYSLFDKEDKMIFYFEESIMNLPEKIKKIPKIASYLNYTQGYPLIRKDAFANIKIYAIKYGPINFYGKPKFIHPLCFNENNVIDNQIDICYNTEKIGFYKNLNELKTRTFGKPKANP